MGNGEKKTFSVLGFQGCDARGHVPQTNDWAGEKGQDIPGNKARTGMLVCVCVCVSVSVCATWEGR